MFDDDDVNIAARRCHCLSGARLSGLGGVPSN
jgi:hypothetical protein